MRAEGILSIFLEDSPKTPSNKDVVKTHTKKILLEIFPVRFFLRIFLQGGQRMDVSGFAQKLLHSSWQEKVSDVYLLPRKKSFEIFFRRQNRRWLHETLPEEDGRQLVRHFKFLANMDIAEKRKPQLGAFTSQMNDLQIRLRLSSVGDYLGAESLVLRFFQEDESITNRYLLYPQNYLESQTKKRGLHLFVGPTGSGKTTLMYRLAKNHPHFQQVITIEDPVEIEEQSFLQLQTNAQIGLTYEALIKVCLRHRPDCLIIGEIRDGETAMMVLRAALTGHVVFATLHAKNLAETYTRLEELGLKKAQVESVMQSVTFQRMVEIICPVCGNTKNLDCQKIHDACLVSVHPAQKWSQQLRKAWAYGFINADTYLQEKD